MLVATHAKKNIMEIRALYVFIKTVGSTPLRLGWAFFWAGLGIWVNASIYAEGTSLRDLMMSILLAPTAVLFSLFISGLYGLLNIAAIGLAVIPTQKVLYGYQRWPEYLQLVALGVFVSSYRTYEEFAWVSCSVAVLLAVGGTLQ